MQNFNEEDQGEEIRRGCFIALNYAASSLIF